MGNSALIVTNFEKDIEDLSGILRESGLPNISVVNNVGEARRCLVNNEFDIIIINTPLSDEFGANFALFATNTNAGVIMLVKAELADQVSLKVENEGVYVISKPIHKVILFQAIKMGLATYHRMVGIKNENLELKNKIEAIRVVDRAKCVLIQYLSMTEAQAHRFIEKQAMDMRISKTQVAQGIIKTYEN